MRTYIAQVALEIEADDRYDARIFLFDMLNELKKDNLSDYFVEKIKVKRKNG